MNDVEKIEITIKSLTKNIELSIFPKTLKCYFNKVSKNVESEDILRLFDIICLWDYNKNIKKSNKIDSEIYNIKVYTEKGIDNYSGIGEDSKGYHQFLELINKYYG